MPGSIIQVTGINDRVLQDNIILMTRATGRTMKEETRPVFKGLVRDGIIYCPPAGGSSTGKDAQRQGQAAIARDLKLMGFAPKELKGHRTITKAFGHPIAPVTVATKENPKFTEPDIFHLARLQAKHGGKVSRGGAQSFYVSKTRFKATVRRLFGEIGKLASGFVKAAGQLGVAVPAWIARHAAENRGSDVQIVETATKLTMRMVNHFPENATNEASEMIRRLAVLKGYAIGRLKRQLPYILRKNLREAKRN